jgi:AcrR family transcriptional regulator
LRRNETEATLLATARTEFLRYGFDGTDVARIARRSGVSPNTFYRCFNGKVDVFITVYLAWATDEQQAFERLIAKRGTAAEIVDAVIARHRQHVWFRRSVRRLAHENTFVRRAVAVVRHDLLATLTTWAGSAADPAVIAADLIQLEQLAATLAECELDDMAMDNGVLRDRLAAMLMRWRVRGIVGPAISA